MLRRVFLSRFSGAAAVFGVGQERPATTAADVKWQPARHAQDDWFEQPSAKHRVLFDTWSADKFSEALGFAGNYVRVNRDEYGLADKDLAVVVVARHRSAPFAFNDAMWAKYGKSFAERMQLSDPKTHEAPSNNLHGSAVSNLIKQGVQLAVCNLTTRAYTRILAQDTGKDAEAIYKELTANTVGNAHFVPAGVVAVTRAQERGYAVVSVG